MSCLVCGAPDAAANIPPLFDALTAEIRDVVEGIHGRPAKRRGVTTVLAEVITADGRPGWIAKVKFGSGVIAKTRYAHFTIEGALGELVEQAKKALGVDS